jgi:UDP-N-acetylglucosamine:LPS N-acetylglucosamine transferase
MTQPRNETILILTSCIGGGHVFRDLAIGEALQRQLPPRHEIVFASGGAAYQMLAAEGVRVEEITGMKFPAHLGTANFLKLYFCVLWSELLQLFDLRRLIKKYEPKLIVLDEYFFLADYCRWLGIPVVFMTDFVGVPQVSLLRNPLRAALEIFFDWWVAWWLPRRAARYIFIGDPQHIPTEAWRERAVRRGIDIVEPITKVQYKAAPARQEARRRLGVSDAEKLVTIAVGCSEVGGYLLEAANRAALTLSDRFPGLRVELVCGMSIDPAAIAEQPAPGVRVHGYVRNLEELFAASDAAAVQCGLTTVTECLMLGVPTVVVPLANHWEQANTARYLREVAGIESLPADTLGAEGLAAAIARLLEQETPPAVTFRGDGHVEAARLILGVLNGAAASNGAGATRGQVACTSERQ